jgi:Helix-turn-helix domain
MDHTFDADEQQPDDALLAEVYRQLEDHSSGPEYDVEAGLRRLQSWMQEPAEGHPDEISTWATGKSRTTTLKAGSRVTGSARTQLAAELKSKYEAGESMRALAQATGRSYGFVHRLLSEAGVILRGRSGAPASCLTATPAPAPDNPDGTTLGEKGIASN